MIRLQRTVSGWIRARRPGAPAEVAHSDALLEQYADSAPSAQNAIDAVPGWTHALPVTGSDGAAPAYDDPRITWCLAQFGSIAGHRILELGPLEGLHTYQLDLHHPATIHAIEANRLSFLRCLITKELLGLKHAKFLHGNFMPWLEQTKEKYDLTIASGVLYHMRDPIRFLELVAQSSPALYLWTHYFSDTAMPGGDHRRGAFSGTIEQIDYQGVKVSLHHRGYQGAWKNDTFCGGMYDRHYWMERQDILNVLGKLGFDDIRIAHDDPGHQFGSALSIFARRSGV